MRSACCQVGVFMVEVSGWILAHSSPNWLIRVWGVCMCVCALMHTRYAHKMLQELGNAGLIPTTGKCWHVLKKSAVAARSLQRIILQLQEKQTHRLMGGIFFLLSWPWGIFPPFPKIHVSFLLLKIWHAFGIHTWIFFNELNWPECFLFPETS